MTSTHYARSSAAAGFSAAACDSFPSALAVVRARIARTVPCETWAAGGGDLAVGESEPPRARDGLLVFAVGLALALGRARDVLEHVTAQRLACA